MRSHLFLGLAPALLLGCPPADPSSSGPDGQDTGEDTGALPAGSDSDTAGPSPHDEDALTRPTQLELTYDPARDWMYFTWAPVPGATAYLVLWRVDPGVTAHSQPMPPTQTIDYGHSGVVPDHVYCYRVQAARQGEIGPLSREVCALAGRADNPLPADPQNLSAHRGGDGAIELSWDPVPGALHYQVFWNTTRVVAPPAPALEPTSQTSQRHEPAAPNAHLCYRVQAISEFGGGPLSREACLEDESSLELR